MPALINIEPGTRFGRLEVIRRAENDDRGNVMWLCRCDCGSEKVVRGDHLRGRNTRSCGCIRKECSSGKVKHGHSLRGRYSRTYRSWRSMKQRCNNPNSPDYKNYGGRGIKVCDRWKSSFEDFLADMGERPEGKTIDRIDVNGNYEPSNCHWATRKQQRANQRVSAT